MDTNTFICNFPCDAEGYNIIISRTPELLIQLFSTLCLISCKANSVLITMNVMCYNSIKKNLEIEQMKKLGCFIFVLIFLMSGCSLVTTETIITTAPQTTSLTTSVPTTSSNPITTTSISVTTSEIPFTTTTNPPNTTSYSTTVETTHTSVTSIILPTPSMVVIDDGFISWAEVEFSSSYIVMIDGIEVQIFTNRFSLAELAVGMHNIRIKACGDQVSYLNSSFSSIFNYEVMQTDIPAPLDSPQNITIIDKRISWEEVPGAISYVVQINEDEHITVLSEYYDFEYNIPGIYLIKIYAKGNGVSSLNSETSTYVHEIDATVLSVVLNLQIIDDIATWNEVENASSYLIKIDDDYFSVETNQFALNIETPGEYLVSVRAIGDQVYFLDSNWSQAIGYSFLATPVFVTVSSDMLFLGSDEFRFVSFNVPNLLILEDPDWHKIDPWEQEDAIRSVRMMGGRVIRTYTLSVVGGIRPAEGGNQLAHIMGIGNYNEELFLCLDKAIQLAGENGVYLIIPFIDEWNWFGGVAEFSALYGKSKTQFFTDATVKQGFKDLLYYVLNRTNTYTGVKYKDDPTILAWELGNELRSATDAWIGEMSAYIKSIDSNHLLMSGRDKITTFDLNNPNIDIVSAHYYTNNGTGTFASRAKADRLLSKGVKPFIIGEYGLVDVLQIENMIIESATNGTSGSLIWSLRFRNVNGGFYYHNDTPTRSYHFPGFSINDDYNETRIIDFIIQYAHLVGGLGQYEICIPDAPYLFAIEDAELTWRGATGSSSFIIERRSVLNPQWQVLATSISDAYAIGPFYIDNTVDVGISYEYRVKAINQAGESEYSNVVPYTQTIE